MQCSCNMLKIKFRFNAKKDAEKWISTECQTICKSEAVSSQCTSKKETTSIHLIISAVGNDVYFPIVDSQLPGKCSACHNILDATIKCDMDKLFLRKGIFIVYHQIKVNATHLFYVWIKWCIFFY